MAAAVDSQNKTRFLSAFLGRCRDLNHATAIFRLPFSQKSYLISGTPVPYAKFSDLDPAQTGFVVHPFDPEQSQEKPVFIKGELFLDLSEQDLNLQHDSTEYKLPDLPDHTEQTSLYTATVKLAKDQILKDSIKKVVLARKKDIPIAANPDLWEMYQSVNTAFPEAFVSLVMLPEGKVWLGASPELLASQNQEGIFRTMALAGTRGYDPAIPPEQTDWKQKEIEEQALVSRYIISCFKSLRLREFEEDGPKTVRAGNLLHLRTEFWVDLEEVNFPFLLKQMVDLLHPTSAVCGMPQTEAMEFIRKEEKLDRQFYSGYLGPVNINKETHLFVNLRCARLYNNRAETYAGAGITGSSDPESELKETELKLRVLEKILSSDTEK